MPLKPATALVVTAVVGGMFGALGGVWSVSGKQAAFDQGALSGRLDSIDQRIAKTESNMRSLRVQPDDYASERGPALSGQRPVEAAIDEELADLVSRLERVEAALGRMGKLFSPGDSHQLLTEQRLAGTNVVSTQEFRSSLQGEAVFEQDGGAALGLSEDGIAELFHASDQSSAVEDIYCKSSVCKVTFTRKEVRYAGSDGGAADPGDDLLLELADKYGLDSLDAHYAIDDQGREVMFIHALEGR